MIVIANILAALIILTPLALLRLQLRRYFLVGMMPMIGFGFVDNAISTSPFVPLKLAVAVALSDHT